MARIRVLKSSSVSQPLECGLINVALVKDRILIFERNGSEVVVRSRPSEYSCFVKKSDIDLPMLQKIQRLNYFKALRDEGEYYRILWNGRNERHQICEALHEAGIQTYEGDVSPVRRYMTDNRHTLAKHRVCFLDIETDSRVPIAKAALGMARILTWAITGEGGEVDSAVLEEDTDECEYFLLKKMIAALNKYDLVCAWNGDNFDFPAITQRMIDRGVARYGDLRRWLWLDQMALFERMNAGASESGDEKASVSLNAIATALLGVGKDEFDASKTYEAWVAGGEERSRLLKYNIVDTTRQKQIEEKTGFVALLHTLAETTNVCPDSRGLHPTVQAEGFLLKLGKERGYLFPTNLDIGNFGEKFKGAYVMDPKGRGILKNIHVGDFASLYPSIIATWNMSPETIVQVGFEGNIPANHSLAPITNTLFNTEKEGILAAAVKSLMALRKQWNKRKAELPPGSPEWVDANRKATAYKVAVNSFYGIIGSAMSRFFNREVAEAVTQAGAWLIMTTMSEAEKQGMIPIYGDTDSAFIGDCSEEEFKRFTEWCNSEFYPNALKNLGCKENLISLAYEKEFDILVFLAAKKYIGRYVHYKGKRADETSKPEIKGLEYKRGDSVKLARDFQAEVIDRLVGMKNGGCDDPLQFEGIVIHWLAEVIENPRELTDVIMIKKLNRELEEYSRKKTKSGEWSKQLPHIELARKLLANGGDIRVGTRIGYYIYDASDKKNVVYRTESEWDGDFDRLEVWEKQVWPPTKRLLEAAFIDYDWSKYNSLRPKKERKRKQSIRKSDE